MNTNDIDQILAANQRLLTYTLKRTDILESLQHPTQCPVKVAHFLTEDHTTVTEYELEQVNVRSSYVWEDASPTEYYFLQFDECIKCGARVSLQHIWCKHCHPITGTVPDPTQYHEGPYVPKRNRCISFGSAEPIDVFDPSESNCFSFES